MSGSCFWKVRIDVIEETIPTSGNIDELSGDIGSIGILIIYTAYLPVGEMN